MIFRNTWVRGVKSTFQVGFRLLDFFSSFFLLELLNMQEWLKTKWRNWEGGFQLPVSTFFPRFFSSPQFPVPKPEEVVHPPTHRFHFHLAPFFPGWIFKPWPLVDPLIVGRSLTLSKKVNIVQLEPSQKGGGRQQCSSWQNCHTVQRLITWGFLLLPLEGLKLQLLFFSFSRGGF